MCDKTKQAEKLIDEYLNLMGRIKNGQTLTPEEINAFAQRSILQTVGSMHDMLAGMKSKMNDMATFDSETKEALKNINTTLTKHDTRITSCEHQKNFKYVSMFTLAAVLVIVAGIGFATNSFKLNADVSIDGKQIITQMK